VIRKIKIEKKWMGDIKMVKKVMVIILLFFAPLLFAHGIKVTVEKKSPFIIINARYHGSKAMAHASVTVVFESEKKEFQRGNTDKNGNFCFYPDRAGKWMVTVDDFLGHRKNKEILIDTDFLNPLPKENEITPADKEEEDKREVEKKPPYNTNEMCCYLLKIVLGVVLILVITFILYRWKKRHET
jgi:hypothetical protein